MRIDELQKATMSGKAMYDQMVAGKMTVDRDTRGVLRKDKRYKERSFSKRIAVAAFHEIVYPSISDDVLADLGYGGMSRERAYESMVADNRLDKLREHGICSEVDVDSNVFRVSAHQSRMYCNMVFDTGYLYDAMTSPKDGAVGVWNAFALMYGVEPVQPRVLSPYAVWLDDAALNLLVSGVRRVFIVPDERPGHEYREATLEELAARISELYLAGKDADDVRRVLSADDSVANGFRDIYGNLIERK